GSRCCGRWRRGYGPESRARAPRSLRVLVDQRARRVVELLALEALAVHLLDPFLVDPARRFPEGFGLFGAQRVNDVAGDIGRCLASFGVVVLLDLAEPGRGLEPRVRVDDLLQVG